MSASFSRAVRETALLGAAFIALAPAWAAAQETARDEDDTASDSDEIVVTGSLIRGAAPVGSNLIVAGPEKMQSSGATTSNELLATIPQVSNYFNAVPTTDLTIAANQIQVTRPNLRNITPRAAASSATLVLFDGHRIATSGTRQALVDPDVIPPAAIERVEVVTEGGSATYGADAVAGVINFISRKRFDGVKVDGRYGFADDYWQVDANVIAGKDWGNGSAYIAYTFTRNDAILGRDRDFIRAVEYSALPYVPLGRQCAPGNVRVTGPAANFRVQDLTTPGVNACDTTDARTFVPAARRHGVVASLYQELSPWTTVETKAFFSERRTKNTGNYVGTVSIGPNNPFYRNIPSRPGAVQNVDFSFAPAFGEAAAISTILIQEWGVNTELRQKLGENWQVRGLFNYSRTNSKFTQPGVATTRLAAIGNAPGLTTATAINPYDPTQTNAAVLADLIDNYNAGQARDDLLDLRLIADGTLFTLPGGDVRVAFGYERIHDELKQREVASVRLGRLAVAPYNTYKRRVNSFFGELNVPLIGPDNASPGLHSLVLSAQGRWDDYSDFGSTFNPKLGATYKPFEWLALRGNWGTSFTPPTPLDQLNARSFTFTYFNFIPFIRATDAAAGVNALSGVTLALQGSRPNLRPQTADTWSLGFDIDPPNSGFRASLTYYNVKFRNILSVPSANASIFINFPDNIQFSRTGFGADFVRGLIAPGGLGFGGLGGATAVQQALADGRPVAEIVDFRVGNFGVLNVSGLDFLASYTRDLGFGSVDLSVSGNYTLKRRSQSSPSAPIINEIEGDAVRQVDGISRLLLQTVLGTTIGRLRAQATWNHSAGFPVPPTPVITVQPNPPVPVQTHVKSFDTVNLFFKYDFGGDSIWTRDLSFTLNVNNVLDQDPPLLLRNSFNDFGYANGFTFGRMFIFGLSKRF